MPMYKDVISHDDLCSDSYPTTAIEFKFNNTIMEVTGRGIDVIQDAKLQKDDIYTDSKKDLMDYQKAWAARMTKGKFVAPERMTAFKKGFILAMKEISANFRDWEVYIGENMSPEGTLVFMNYKEDGVTPYFWFFKDALVEEEKIGQAYSADAPVSPASSLMYLPVGGAVVMALLGVLFACKRRAQRTALERGAGPDGEFENLELENGELE